MTDRRPTAGTVQCPSVSRRFSGWEDPTVRGAGALLGAARPGQATPALHAEHRSFSVTFPESGRHLADRGTLSPVLPLVGSAFFPSEVLCMENQNIWSAFFP